MLSTRMHKGTHTGSQTCYRMGHRSSFSGPTTVLVKLFLLLRKCNSNRSKSPQSESWGRVSLVEALQEVPRQISVPKQGRSGVRFNSFRVETFYSIA